MTPADYFDLCAAHDWTYQFTESFAVYRRGRDEENRLERLAAGQADLRVIYEAWRSHIFSGPAYGTPPVPRPERPENTASDRDGRLAA